MHRSISPLGFVLPLPKGQERICGLDAPAFLVFEFASKVYLCFSSVLAFLWYEPMKVSHGILLFALVVCCDLSALLIFLLPKAVKWLIPEKGENGPNHGRLLTMEAGQIPTFDARVDFPTLRTPPPSVYLHPHVSHERPRSQESEWVWGTYDNVTERVPEPVSAFSVSTSPTGILRDHTAPSPQTIAQGPKPDNLPPIDIGMAPGSTRSVDEKRFTDKHISSEVLGGQGRLRTHSQYPTEQPSHIHPHFLPSTEGFRHVDTSHLASADVQAPHQLGAHFELRTVGASTRGNVI